MTRGFLRSTSLVGAMTLVSRVTGLVRDMVYSQAFGAGTLMDAFLVAFKIPNFLRRLTAEGAFSQAFVPVISEYRVQRPHEDVRGLVAGMSGTLGVVLFVATVIGVLAAPVLIYLFAPGFRHDGSRFDMAVEMLRFTFPYLLFISLTALGSGVLNSYGRFGVPAFNSTLMNLIMILFAVVIAPYFANPGLVLAIGVFVSGVAQLVAQYPALARLGLLVRPRWGWNHDGVRRIGRLMLPGIFGSSVAQVSLLLDTVIASFLVTGSIAWMYYADRLVEFPMGVFAIALGTVILPGLSAQHAAKSVERFQATLDWALRLTFVIALPAAVGLFALAGPLTATIFGYGEFNARDVEMSSYALMAYALGLMGFSLVKVLAPGYFARQDTKTPVKVGMISLGANMAFNVVVVVPAHLAGFVAPHALLALSTGMSAILNSSMLYRGLRRAGVYRPSTQWRRLWPRLLLANALLAAFLWLAAGDWAAWSGYAPVTRMVRLGACVGGGFALYFGVLWLTGLRYRDLKVAPPP